MKITRPNFYPCICNPDDGFVQVFGRQAAVPEHQHGSGGGAVWAIGNRVTSGFELI